jgi:GNAT superfamily N-acetyltransferase
MNEPSDSLLKQLTQIDPQTDMAYVAVIDDGTNDHEVGVARFSAQADGTGCEFAIVVSDNWQNKGIGTHLMYHLIEAARAFGIGAMHSSDAQANELMRRFACHLHLDHKTDPNDATQVLYSVGLGPRNGGLGDQPGRPATD